MPSAVVVGAGIGGLSAALGLHRIGWQVTVLERAREFTTAGAGITLMPNAFRALDVLGIGLRDGAVGFAGVRTSSGQWLLRWDPAALRHLVGAPMVGLSRAKLHRLLLDALPAGLVQTGVEVTKVPDAELVVAADGIDSQLRARLWPQVPAPVYNGVTTWRGIAPPPTNALPGVVNSWGRGTEFGVVPLPRGRVYWWGAVPVPEGESHPDERAAVAEHFAGWHTPIPELIATSETLLHLDIRYLARPPRSFVNEKVVLLGDAAHAMPPNLGQGAGLAIEDGVVLAAALAGARTCQPP